VALKPIEGGNHIKNHYGIYIDTEKPVTGVWDNNEIEWLGDAIQDGIDLAWEEHVDECPNEEHDDCGPQESSDFLIGDWKKDEKGLYEPDPDGEYSAIVREIYTQVVLSKWAIRGNACSPCYPGQAEPGIAGEQLLYAPPPDLLGDDHPRKGEVIKIR